MIRGSHPDPRSRSQIYLSQIPDPRSLIHIDRYPDPRFNPIQSTYTYPFLRGAGSLSDSLRRAVCVAKTSTNWNMPTRPRETKAPNPISTLSNKSMEYYFSQNMLKRALQTIRRARSSTHAHACARRTRVPSIVAY